MKAQFKLEFKKSATKIPAKEIRKEFKSHVVATGREVRKDYKFVQRHFSSKNRSKIRSKSGSSPDDGGTIYSAVGINEDRGQVLIWLEDGTQKRWRQMSYKWVSKSKGGLKFGRGRGAAMGWKKWPYPGIQARNFRDAIVEKQYPDFVKKFESIFRRLLRSHRWTSY